MLAENTDAQTSKVNKAGTQGKQEVTLGQTHLAMQAGMQGSRDKRADEQLVGAQARLVGQTGKAGGSAGKVDKAEGLVGHTNWEVRQEGRIVKQDTHKR
jgi:hypothetical protein